jgi:hypothetical protein
MRILVLTQRFPFPPDRGDRIRSFHILRHLARRHEISLASLTDEDIDEVRLAALRDICVSVDVARIHGFWRKAMSLFYLPTRTPLTLPNYYSRELKEKIRRRLETESFDIIFIYCSSMAPYVLECDRIPKVVDFVDVDSEKWLEYGRSRRPPVNLVYFRESYLLRRYEKRISKSCCHLFVASRREKDTLSRFVEGKPITTITNGVNISSKFTIQRSGARMIFTGVMDYWPNEDAACYFVNEIFPIISEKLPGAEFVIVGQKPTRRVMQLSRVKGVTVTGWVQDPAKYMDEATVFVAPIRVARGIQNKVLEAMGCGLPVVATSAAADGLEAMEARDYLLGDSATTFAEQVLLLLRDGELRERLATTAVGYIREKHDWSFNMKEMEKILVDVVESKKGRE